MGNREDRIREKARASRDKVTRGTRAPRPGDETSAAAAAAGGPLEARGRFSSRARFSGARLLGPAI